MASDQEIMAPSQGGGFFGQMFAARGINFGARAERKRQQVIAKTLNEEIEAEIGDATSVDLQKVLPSAYFNAARRIAALGNSEEAQKLYAAGMQATQTTAEYAANLAKTKATTDDLNEAPTEYLEALRQRDALAETIGKFDPESPTGKALNARMAALNERLKVLNERGATDNLPREVLLAQQFDADRATNSGQPGTAELIWGRERQTSGRAQDYANYVAQEKAAGRTPVSYDKFTPDFAGQLASGTEGGKRAVTRLDDDENNAQQAVASLSSIKNSLDLLNEGVRTGTLAGARQSIARAIATFTGDDPNAATVNTDAYIATSAPRVVEIVRALAPVTDQDKEYIQAAVGGNLNVATPEAMRKLLEIASRTQMAKIDRYNTRLGVLGEEYTNIAEDFKPVTAPKLDFAAPGESQKAISELTDEELAAEARRLGIK